MNINQAKEVIEKYKKVVSIGPLDGTVLRKVSWLPYSTAKLKYAFYTLIDDCNLNYEQKKQLVSLYSTLCYFIDDYLADKYSKNYNEWQSKKLDPLHNKRDETVIKQYIAYTTLLRARSDELKNEITAFIDDVSYEQN